MKTTNRTSKVTASGFLALAGLLSVLVVAPAYAVHHDTAANAGLQGLTFSRHIDTAFTLATATTAMTNATNVIGICNSTPTADQDVACQVTMQVSGGIGSFGSTGDGGDVISSDAEMNTLINSGTANVMVVTAIGFCSGPAGPGLTIIGCGNVGARGIVSVSSLPGNLLGVEITHEFLHNQGHSHRGDGGEAAAIPGAILNPILSLSSNIINEAECASMHSGSAYTAANNGPIVDPPPVLTCPAPLTVECTSSSGALKTNPAIAAFLASFSATHGCEPAPTLTNNAPAVFPMGTTGVKFTATDPDWLGSSADCTVNVRVVDTTPPSITCPLAITVECTQSGGTPKTHPAIAAFLAGASASDACDPSPTITNNAPPFFPDGTTHVTFTAKDADNNASQCVADVHVVDTTPPVITCPAAITVECNDHCAGGGVPDTDPAIAAFLAGASATDICDPAPVITNNHLPCFHLGDNIVTFTATDASTNHASCNARVRVVDTTPPVITVALDRCVLWPPNHKMVDINAAVTVTDVCDPAPTFVLTSISSDEPINGLGDGDTAPDWANAATGTSDVAFQLRSERSGKGNGRKYTIVYTASDASGNTATAQVNVYVPHDQSGGALCADGLSSDGTGFSDGANWFALVVPSIDPSVSGNDVLLEGGTDAGSITMGDGSLAPRIRTLYAGDIDAATVLVGNFKGALSPFRTRLTDVNGDGLNDAVYYYRVADVKALKAASATDDGPLGLHFQVSPTVSFLVNDIFALGAPVKLPADVSSVPVDHNPIDARAGSTGGAEGATTTDPATVRVLPSLTRFSGVYPNPFDAGTTLAFDLAADHQVRLAVYDLRGALVQTLRSGWLPAGRYNVAWDGRDRDGRAVPGGVYLVRFDAGGKSFTRKAVLMK